MIKILIFLVSLFIIFWVLRFVIGYFNLVFTRAKAFKLFLEIDKKLTGTYYKIKTASPYIAEYVEVEPTLKSLDRKVALNYIILQSLEENIDEGAKDVIRELETSIKEDKETYNKYASRLKYALEVYPSSFIARLMEYRTVDFFKMIS